MNCCGAVFFARSGCRDARCGPPAGMSALLGRKPQIVDAALLSRLILKYELGGQIGEAARWRFKTALRT